MSFVVVMNPNSGSIAQNGALFEEIAGRPGWVVRETEHAGHAEQIARALRESAEVTIVSAGGDGTLHEVANGLGPGAAASAALLPLGTGNDFARAVGIYEVEPVELLDRIERAERAGVDLIRVRCGGAERYAINAANGGNSELTEEAIDTESKKRWGPLAYVFGAVKVVTRVRTHALRVAIDGGDEFEIDAYGIVIANGRSLGGGVEVAPRAEVGDGALDVAIIKEISAPMMMWEGAKMLRGLASGDHEILEVRAAQVRVRAEPPIWFNLDGESFECGDYEFSVCPGALKVAGLSAAP